MKKNDCENCASTGFVECTECGGTGKAQEAHVIYEDEAYEKEICFTCEGIGTIACPHCNSKESITEDSKK